ncbi:hypothetical protein H6P81_007409 [Aristolochia fimbriata]|uniref:TmcB/TmcC TPR repeats domain-containing protein n=1 Tax=Aristolochia fimbriata TaxID=158543 RepID=A0AAV7F045_ARIFI|nr:hypothetical protein H6P81_007409 [Aristolochia fimbriata]
MKTALRLWDSRTASSSLFGEEGGSVIADRTRIGEMKTLLLRTTSLGSPRLAFSDQDPGAAVSFPGRNCNPSPKPGTQLRYANDRNAASRSFRRTLSETNLGLGRTMSRRFSRSFQEMIAKEREVPEKTNGAAEGEEGDVSVLLKRGGLELGIRDCVSGMWSVNEVLTEEDELTGGGGAGEGRKDGGGRGGGRGGGGDGVGDLTGGSADQNRMGAYYRELLKANPGNPLLLRNYGRYLHEVEKDLLKAEEYYGRAILASPEDGEVLSLYGKLIWETQRDEGRAQAYFDQAIKASPDDCYVLGSYAHFLWDAEEEDEEVEVELKSSSMVGAF